MCAHWYTDDHIRAIDAKFEAQKIAFAPLVFQAARALRTLGLLRAVSDAGDNGITRASLADATGVPPYGTAVLAEMALGMGAFKLRSEDGDTDAAERYVLGKIGWFLLEDAMTGVNMDFTNDICYEGAFKLTDAITGSTPAGLAVFGERWKGATIYEALSSLPEQAKNSWFAFDHFYSDIAFPEALPIVFAESPARLFDIGGNTAKWAIQCCTYNPSVRVTIIDLPGQTAVAEQNAAVAGFADRISTYPCNVLDHTTTFPSDAAEAGSVVWMSQFLDCFSLEQVTTIAAKVAAAAGDATAVYVLEPLWDKQRFEASSYSLQATSLYFTCMANGTSKMYRYAELVQAIEAGGLTLKMAHHHLGSNAYSLLRFQKAAS